MVVGITRKKAKKLVLFLAAFFMLLVALFIVFINRFLEPILRNRLHTLIIQGSDSLYQYKLGKLNANFFGGNVEVEDLQIKIDSARYLQLARQNALPALTMDLNLVKGQIKGLGVASLIFGRTININEIVSKDANIHLLRHVRQQHEVKNTLPLWRAIRPVIKSISIAHINLDGVKLLYKNADTSEAVKLQFDRCVARFDDIKVDSVASNDTTRIGFVKNIFMQFNDLKFRTADSANKLKADTITYSSVNRTFEIINFKIQPTLKDRDDFYAAVNRQKPMNVITFKKMLFTNIRLDRFVYNNMVVADSIFLFEPEADIYIDKTYPPLFESKMGKYPQQLLLKANETIIIKGIAIKNASLHYTEKNNKTLQEGTVALSHLNINMANITNDSNTIKQFPKCLVNARGNIFGSSPFAINIVYYLNETNGRFDADGEVQNVTASQLNEVAEPLASTKLQSFNMHQLNFTMQGDDLSATSNVSMRYDHLYIVLQKTNEETGDVKTKKFLTKILNKFTLYDSNPGPDGVMRKAVGAQRARISSQSFFALVWKSIFTGMQGVMMKSGSYD